MKKINHGLVSLCLAAAVFAPVASHAETKVYGKFLLGLENVDKERTPSEPNNTDAWEVESHASRFGVKGSMETDHDSLEVVYKLEWEVDVTDEKDTKDNHIKSRDQYAGLKGNFGEFVLGRRDTPFKKAQGKIDIFNDIADIKLIMAGGENREDNIWQYTSPKIADSVKIKVMGRPGEEDEVDPVTGDAENGIADATSFSVSYDSDTLHLAVAQDSDIEGEGVDATRFVGSAKLGKFGVGLLYQTTDWAGGVEATLSGTLTPAALAAALSLLDDEEVTIFSAYAKINKVKLKLQTGTTDNYGGVADIDADYTVFGIDYSLAKKTTVGFFLSDREGGDGLQVTAPGAAVPVSQTKDRFGFTLVHSF